MASVMTSWRQALQAGGVAGLLACWRWQLCQSVRALWRRLGWLGLAGVLGLLLGMLALGGSVLQRQAWQQWQAQQASDALQPRRAQPIDVSAHADDAGQDRARLHAFLTGLPSHRDIPSVVQTLLTLADQHGVAMLKGDYQFQPDTNAGFARYRMSLPVRGSSTQVRRFLGAALKAQPSLGLESVQLRREQVQADQVEARVEWVLYTRLPTSGPEARP